MRRDFEIHEGYLKGWNSGRQLAGEEGYYGPTEWENSEIRTKVIMSVFSAITPPEYAFYIRLAEKVFPSNN